MAKPIPEGYHALTPTLAVDNASQAIEFYKRAFGAKERGRMPGPGNTVAHAELEIGDSVLMLADPMPQSTLKPPKELRGTSVGIFLYVEDVDEVVGRRSVRPRVADRHAHAGPHARGDHGAQQGGDGQSELRRVTGRRSSPAARVSGC